VFSRYDRDSLVEVINRSERLGSRRIRGRLSEVFNQVHLIAVWFLFSPVVLACQTLPERDQKLTMTGI